MTVNRCQWCKNDPLLITYHDTEWGVPLHDDRKIFEFLVLDTFQAGLSWAIILRKRQNLQRAFAEFDPRIVAEFDNTRIAELLVDKGIIRNAAKIRATIQNARAFLQVQQEYGSFTNYIWQFVNYRPVINQWKREEDIPTTSCEAENLSADLIRRGFQFAGPTICYAFMQAAGLVNDHLVTCFRYPEIIQSYQQMQPESGVVNKIESKTL